MLTRLVELVEQGGRTKSFSLAKVTSALVITVLCLCLSFEVLLNIAR